MLKKLIGTFLWFWMLQTPVLGQDSLHTKHHASKLTKYYKTAFGLQFTGIGSAFANPKGLSFKHFISSASALELNLTPGGRNIVSTNIVGQRYFEVVEVPLLQWYAGAGINLDLYRYRRPTTPPDLSNPIVATTTTLIGTVGAEYKIAKLPFTISGDIKKGFFGYSSRGVEKHYNLVQGLRPSISFRYIFNS